MLAVEDFCFRETVQKVGIQPTVVARCRFHVAQDGYLVRGLAQFSVDDREVLVALGRRVPLLNPSLLLDGVDGLEQKLLGGR